VERRIERAFFQAKNATGDLFDPESDGVAVHPALRRQGLEDDEVEGTLQAIVRVLAHAFPYSQLLGNICRICPCVNS